LCVQTSARPLLARQTHALVIESSWNPNARALQAVRFQKLGVVPVGGWSADPGCGVVRIGRCALEDTQQNRRVGYGSSHGSRGVMVGRDWDYAVAADPS